MATGPSGHLGVSAVQVVEEVEGHAVVAAATRLLVVMADLVLVVGRKYKFATGRAVLRMAGLVLGLSGVPAPSRVVRVLWSGGETACPQSLVAGRVKGATWSTGTARSLHVMLYLRKQREL